MTYIIDGPEMDKVAYTKVIVEFINVETDEVLHKKSLIEVRNSKSRPDVERIVNAEDKEGEFCHFCNMQKKEDEAQGYMFFSFHWSDAKLDFKKELSKWSSFIRAGLIYMKWSLEDTYHYHERPRRRIPLGTLKGSYITLQKRKS